jgi:uncharacterized membrane protein YcaP (DUF421 family)
MDAIDWVRMWRPEHHPLETALRAAVAYLFVHVAFRMVGRKELGRHSTYEIVLLLFVSVAMRQTIVGKDESLTTGALGFATLLLIDTLVAWIVRLSPRAARLIDGPVRELARDGRLDQDAMKRARITREQLLAALRSHGRERLEDVRRAYLERSGRISVVFRRRLAADRARRRGSRRERAAAERSPRSRALARKQQSDS